MNWSGHLADRGSLPHGTQTQHALRNFAVRGTRLADLPDLVHSLAAVKVATARTNAQLGVLNREVAEAIVVAAERIRRGEHDDQFVLPVVQGGGGTSTHMCLNETIATLATDVLTERGIRRAVHANDDVNASQSTNDVMPTGIALAVRAATDRTATAVRHLSESLEGKAVEYAGLEHLGRTCLRDAVALPVSAVHRAHATGVTSGLCAIETAVSELMAVPLGGTAVGTGIGAPEGFAETSVSTLSEVSGFALTVAADPYFSLSSLEPLVSVAEAIDRCARSVARVGSDLRLLASGPVGGLGEVVLPQVQAGSSIMPGKVNPVMPELVMQLSFQIAGHATSARSASAAGELEVSAMAPVVTLGLLDGLERLGSGARLLADRCIAELRWDESRVDANLAGSLSPTVVASTTDGYDVVAARRHAAGGQLNPEEQ